FLYFLFFLFLLPLFLMHGEKGEVIEIWVDGKHVLDCSLKKDTILVVEGKLGASRVEIREGKVRMLESPCPLKLCMRRGWIEKRGEEIICVPQRIVVRIKGRDEYDAVTH
ncbi:NusG domain II-containing protein, partial [bacterium]